VTATGLRHRPVAEKSVIISEVVENLWPLIEAGEVRPVVHEVLPVQRAPTRTGCWERRGVRQGILAVR